MTKGPKANSVPVLRLVTYVEINESGGILLTWVSARSFLNKNKKGLVGPISSKTWFGYWKIPNWGSFLYLWPKSIPYSDFEVILRWRFFPLGSHCGSNIEINFYQIQEKVGVQIMNVILFLLLFFVVCSFANSVI